MAQPFLNCDNEAWTVINKNVSKINASKMRFLNAAAEVTNCDYKKNIETLKELEIQTIMQFIGKCSTPTETRKLKKLF